ncbi:acyl-coenzyme A thioesterase 5-like, partial [Arapaima gigas]
RKKDVQTPAVVQISVYSGHLAQGFGEQAVLARAVVERWYTAPGVRRVAVSERGVSGTLFLPPGPGPFPAVLDMWGGGGGLVEYRAALLASHGFVTFSLQYLSVSGPAADVHLSYFETAFKILQEHHLVAGERVAVLGLSFAASLCLSMAAYSEEVQPKCCVCISGSHAQPLKMSLLAVFENLNKNVHKARIDEKNRVIWRDLLLPIPTDPDMKIDVGRIKCPLLVIYGTDDLNWPAAESAEDVSVTVTPVTSV